MGEVGAGWKKVGRMLAARRVALGWSSRAKFAKDHGAMSERVYADIEVGRRDNYDPATLTVLEHTYRWGPGSILNVVNGGEPVELDTLNSNTPVLSESSRIHQTGDIAVTGSGSNRIVVQLPQSATTAWQDMDPLKQERVLAELNARALELIDENRRRDSPGSSPPEGAGDG